jgi:hypothetical protein
MSLMHEDRAHARAEQGPINRSLTGHRGSSEIMQRAVTTTLLAYRKEFAFNAIRYTMFRLESGRRTPVEQLADGVA